MQQTRTASVEVLSDGIVRARIFPEVVQSLEDAQENIGACERATGGTPRPLLLDIRRSERLEAGVRHFYTGERLTESFTALGLLVAATPVGRTMGNIYLRIARPGIPTRLFVEEDAALVWLREDAR